MSDPAPPDQAASNSLGLDLDALKINDGQDSAPSAPEDVPPASADASQEADENKDEGEVKDDSAGKKDSKEKKKPYVNPDRVKTGGAQREKPSEEELAERMARIREQNEKIKQRRLDVQADEDEYKKKQEADRAKLAKQKKVQESVDKAREQNARRKLEKIQGREWDSGKPTREWNKPRNEQTGEDGEQKPQPSIGIRGAVRGGSRGRGGGGRGRGRGGAVSSPTSEKNDKEGTPIATADASAPAAPVAASS